MVNGWLKLPSAAADIGQCRCQRQNERIFATKAALTNRSDELRALRSRFGSSDSWSIN
jgi:hypothetical protein